MTLQPDHQPDHPRPLTRGYSREPAVVAEIRATAAMPSAEFWRRLAIADYQHPQAIRSETLVYWARDLLRRGRTEEAWRIVGLLAERAKRTTARRLAAKRSIGHEEREEVADAIFHALYLEWMDLGPAGEFWEVRFGVVLERTISDEAARYTRVHDHETVLSPLDSGDDAPLDPWDLVTDERASDIETTVMVRQALEQLDEPIRTAFRMVHFVGATEEDVAAYLGCTSRTIRNYLRRAREKLQAWQES